MSMEDKDVITQQVKQLAESADKSLDLETIKELISFDQSSDGMLADDEFETILLVTNIQKIQAEKKLNDEVVSNELAITSDDLEELLNGERFATPSELIAMRNFLMNNYL
ncbi:hypothetical protein QQG09_00185 [Melissococcus plutonius]|uniref:EF-hand domain-containing protein n=2 Tax=Melissococcus plutonius TaxID=33970 RepID=F3Y8N9_MELPT|nr:hypothetical protein [Melissococcus plutonius]BAL62716.1 hypothetical protein MPD5_1513 [Melissococcus plutonius DAT561]AIM25550.1 hypothetical protein MEPL_c003470 [Melissococcus plutonius S1]KMT24606.1 hypothetical protein MEPL2_2c00930 [Melissococcus plutonius]KMT27319.1 hypothetical protein MEPL3_1c03750 [Melissococcus plutonius]KMT27492.1 hypothetical protein MEPL1_3c00860 [Melissococcus plutonius]